MKELPIIFSAAMVRALLDGRKAQTRRILKPQPAQWQAMVIDITPPFFNEEEGGWGQVETIWSGPLVPGMCEPEREEWSPLRLPYAVGDRLWVREAFITGFDIEDATGRPEGEQKVWYRADSPWPQWYDADSESTLDSPPWKSPIHMPRWSSRITLEVTEVRVQRLQEISGEDTIVEGVQCPTCEAMKYSACHDSGCFHSLQLFKELWNGLHGPGAWEANPWVAAISFKRIT